MNQLLSVLDINLSTVTLLLHKARQMKDLVKSKGGLSILKNKVLTSLFYEPSTRTSCSFQAAMLRLGGSVINVDVGNSSMQKGETLEDTIQTVSCYSDIIVMRHPEKNSVTESAKISDKPFINAGDGTGEHPTQALLDLYTIQSEIGQIGKNKFGQNMNITFVGDLKHSRTVHSLVKLLTYFPDVIITYISPDGLSMPEEIVEFVNLRGLEQRTGVLLEEAIKETDVLYVTRIQKERFATEEEYRKVVGSYCIDTELMKLAKKKMIVMHPLPRLDEIDRAVDNDPRAAYFRQMENGMYMRMAILECMLL